MQAPVKRGLVQGHRFEISIGIYLGTVATYGVMWDFFYTEGIEKS